LDKTTSEFGWPAGKVAAQIFFAAIRRASRDVGEANLVLGNCGSKFGLVDSRHPGRPLKLSSWILRRADARRGEVFRWGTAVSVTSWVCYLYFIVPVM
jgi:hypothetical protein